MGRVISLGVRDWVKMTEWGGQDGMALDLLLGLISRWRPGAREGVGGWLRRCLRRVGGEGETRFQG